jgi:hypothetical protein
MKYKITGDIKNKTRPLNPIPLRLIYWTPMTPPPYNLKRGIQKSLEIATQGLSEEIKK